MKGPIRMNDLKIQSLGGNGAHEQEESVIRVEVEWDGKKEEFDLQVRK
ncbi:hypothetical protein GCM10010912_15720 [Paenibacillus albidus]|uniref:Uncharacterized protein n=1 Tax=Paenibacillus albidus TaxID=2041023 RepID=A0A917C5R8_9BACL|nr:hypothetical protein [Paenibacillus albidus]GGF71420.1 hypothetical protein GCM10010912_15720 [Paenibacillus albidus]